MMDRDNITRTGAKDPWGREARASRTAARRGAARLGLRARPEGPQRKRAKGRCKPSSDAGMPGAGLTAEQPGKARSDRLALKPYRGKPAVRNFREGDGDVGIMRSPVRAIALPDCPIAELDLPHPRYCRPRRVTPTVRAWFGGGAHLS